MMHQPVIIVGAPRSGTNMLRDMLVKLPGVGTWPCDEINYIWRHGNLKYPSDEFLPEMATKEVQKYIRKKFEKLSVEQNLNVVVEKTCANSLRVGFVDEVIPDSKYIYIVRDGIDAVGSAMKRWKANLDIPYILKKAKYVPPGDLPYYASRYLFNHLHRMVSKDKQLAFWGPSINEVDKLLEKYSLMEVCALQWKRCVDNAERDFSSISPDRIIRVKYEDFVARPELEFKKIADFLGQEVSESVRQHLRNSIRSESLGKGRIVLGDEEVNRLTPLVEDSLRRYGYE